MSCDLVSGHVLSCDLPPFTLPSLPLFLLRLVRSGVVSECGSSSLSSSSSLSHENAFLSRNDSFRLAVLEVGVCVACCSSYKMQPLPFSSLPSLCLPFSLPLSFPSYIVHTFRTESARQIPRSNSSHHLLLLFLLPGMLVRQRAHQTAKNGTSSSLIPITSWTQFHVDQSHSNNTLIVVPC